MFEFTIKYKFLCIKNLTVNEIFQLKSIARINALSRASRVAHKLFPSKVNTYYSSPAQLIFFCSTIVR